MLDNLQLWVYGTAAVIDTVLLFAFLERHNWRSVTIWMLLLAVGIWCWHTGTFVRFLTDLSVGPLANPVRWLSMFVMAFGLMLMPSAALHGACRLLRHGGIRVGASCDLRMGLCYLPMLLLFPMGRDLAVDPTASFLDLLSSYRLAYSGWLCGVTTMTSYALLKLATKGEVQLRRFYCWVAMSMILITVMTLLFVFILERYPGYRTVTQTLVGVSPIIPVLLFGYFVMRFQLLPLILKRTLVFGAILIGVMLFHAVVLRDAVSGVTDQYRLDMGVVEGILIFLVILFYRPLRERVSAALQSLVESSGERRSERSRLSVQMAARATDSPQELLDWFCATMPRLFGSNLAAGWLCQRDGQILYRTGSSQRLNDDQVQQILIHLAKTDEPFVSRYSSVEASVLEMLDQVRAGALLRFEHADLSGLFLIGCQHWGQPPNDEDLHSLSLLVEQFGVTLHNSQLQQMQSAAEHRVFQQEKLSALGLLAGSLAHEIKNPLSSIKTIARVLAEEFGSDSPYSQDLRMISGEVDRLAASTSELLEAARPPRSDRPAVSIAELLAPTLRLLQFMARERKATLEISFPDVPTSLPMDQVCLREIVFNLISNGLDAAGPGGFVRFLSTATPELLTIEVHDNGPGIPAEQRARIFEPFFTTKQTGTGLGLFVVARRVRELGGQIELNSGTNQSTIFRLTLPIQNSTRLEETTSVR